MSNNQAAVEDLIDELYDVLEKGWSLPLSGGKSFIDTEEARQILDEIREAIPAEVRKAKAIVADRAQIISEAQREAETIVRVAEEKAKTLVNQEEIVRMLEQDKSITDICKRFGLSRDTFAKFRRKYPAVQRALSDKEKRRVQQFRKNRL